MGAVAVNIAFGQDTGAPSAAYAAAGEAGTWNAVAGTAGPTYTLVATDGSPTTVTVSQSPTTTVIMATDPAVSGDDAALLDHGLVTTGAETCLFFKGVPQGTYEVLIYAWLPNQPSVLSRTRQDSAPSTIDVGGAWPGAHAEGTTYARYVVTVGTDGMLPAHSGLAPGAPAAALNGVQIRPLPAGAPDAAPIADPDAGTSSTPHHGGGCDAGGGAAGWLVVLGAIAFARRRTQP